MTVRSWIDHLVIAAETLDQGADWCERTLGVTPLAGGEHPFMGTHNRLLTLACEQHPQAYLEIIAINPRVASPARPRWFDLDDPALRDAVRAQPRLIHFVAATLDADAGTRALQNLSIDRGALVDAERDTPHGTLRWRISVRDDGQRLFYGGLPTLIQWTGKHPTSDMPPSGLRLQSLQARHPRAGDLRAAHEAIGLVGVGVQAGAPDLVATFSTPMGMVTVASGGT